MVVERVNIAPDDVVILSAVRTPIGSLQGQFVNVSAHQLGATVIREAVKRAHLDANDVNEVIMGQVLVAGHGQNPSRQASKDAGIPDAVPAHGLSMVCGSGLRSIIAGYESIKAGNADVIVAGGQESMSQARHVVNMRQTVRFGHQMLEDTMLCDGLTDSFHRYHMGITAENLVDKFAISRVAQDTFAYESQSKAIKAQQDGHFKSQIIPVEVPAAKGANQTVAVDEYIKPGVTVDSLAKLRPAFKPSGGSVTAGNSSGLNDGAAALVLVSGHKAKEIGLMSDMTVVRIKSTAVVGCDPSLMGLGPVGAVKKAASKAGWNPHTDIDLFELNEAFAVQALAVIQELGVEKDRVNVSGGAIALGHPIGASGARILVTLVHNLCRLKLSRGCAALCVGGGLGVAVCVERIDVSD